MIKNKYGEDYNSQSDEQQDDQKSLSQKESEEGDIQEKQAEPLIESIEEQQPSPFVKPMVSFDQPTIVEKNEISESSSSEDCMSQKQSNQV